MILLIGSQYDPHLMAIREKLNRQRQVAEILSTDKEDLLNTEFIFSSDNESIVIQNGKKFRSQDIQSAFCLTPLYQRDYQKPISKTENYWFFTWRESLYGFYSVLGEKKVLINRSIYNAIAAQSKIRLNVFASKVGLKLPNTLISNKKKEIENFFQENNEVVIKTLHQTNLWLGDKPTMLLVKRVIEKDFQKFESTGEAPLFLQQAINKIYDLRAIIIGQEIILCKIDASQSDLGKQDWRAYDLPKTKHEIITVDKSLKRKLHQLMEFNSLDYACVDLCIDSNNQPWVLDVNPFGRFLWIERLLNTPISSKIADFLITR